MMEGKKGAQTWSNVKRHDDYTMDVIFACFGEAAEKIYTKPVGP